MRVRVCAWFVLCGSCMRTDRADDIKVATSWGRRHKNCYWLLGLFGLLGLRGVLFRVVGFVYANRHGRRHKNCYWLLGLLVLRGGAISCCVVRVC